MGSQADPLHPIGPDVDLDAEDVRIPDGRRLTEATVSEIVERVHKRHRGRPSLSRTPVMTVRVSSDARAALEAIATAQGRRLADVSRDALDDYIRRHAG
ncbi:MAG: hypothetical protein ACRDRT_01450 [Pseudonocardiaceae bacterium]